MCVGQLGSLLPHVVVPSILAAFLIPEWHLSGAQAGLLAGSGAAGPLMMCTVCFLLRPVEPKPATGRLLDFAPVFQNRKAMGFVLGYGAHCFELYGIRTWIVAFWTFVAARNSDAPILTPIVVSVLFSLLAMPASILGNEFALRFGRYRAITIVMLSSAAVALLIGALADKSPWLLLRLILVYAITV